MGRQGTKNPETDMGNTNGTYYFRPDGTPAEVMRMNLSIPQDVYDLAYRLAAYQKQSVSQMVAALIAMLPDPMTVATPYGVAKHEELFKRTWKRIPIMVPLPLMGVLTVLCARTKSNPSKLVASLLGQAVELGQMKGLGDLPQASETGPHPRKRSA